MPVCWIGPVDSTSQRYASQVVPSRVSLCLATSCHTVIGGKVSHCKQEGVCGGKGGVEGRVAVVCDLPSSPIGCNRRRATRVTRRHRW